MSNFKNIGHLIQHRREELGMSQDQLAEKIEVSKTTISLYESGDRKPTLTRLYDIARHLNLPIGTLLEFELPHVDINVALRSEGIVNKEDIEIVKKVIHAVRSAREGKKAE